MINTCIINTDRCICFKNKNSNEQCNKKRVRDKNGILTEYCGIHLRAKTKRIFDGNKNVNVNNIKIIDDSKEDNDNICYDFSDFRLRKSCTSFKLDILRNTMNKHNISFDLKMRKKELYFILRDFFITIDENKKNIAFIIKIQKWFRAINLLKRCKCQNSHDFYTNNNMFEVKLSEVFIIRDISSCYYWFEVETFGILLDKSDLENIKNPYTHNDIDLFYIKKFNNKYENKEFNISLQGLNEEQISRNKVVEVFQKINKLDNYSDFNWFYDLSLKYLKQMYAICEDIWNYRAQLTWDSKKNIVSDGLVFRTPPFIVQKYTNKELVRDMLVKDFDRLCSEGKTKDDKKVGAMLILTALVEVSQPASIAMPQYVQSANVY